MPVGPTSDVWSCPERVDAPTSGSGTQRSHRPIRPVDRTRGQVRDTLRVVTLRFGAGTFGAGRDDLVATVRKTEALGYDTFLLPDHLFQQLAPIPALAVVAELTDRLRIGTWVLCNDFHHPVIVARELATLDALSGGRLDVGLGAGYIRLEYDNAGIPFETGGRRFRRLQDSVAVIKALWQDGPVTLDNEHFHLRDQVGSPLPVQRPHPPLLLGGGGPKMLTWAATEADIVSIIPAAATTGGLLASELTVASLQRKIALVQAAAPERFARLTLNVGLWDMVVTNDRRSAARAWLDDLRSGKRVFWNFDQEMTEDDLLSSPYLGFGTPAEIAAHIEQVHATTGVSYYTIFPHLVDAFGPVLALIKN